jgi:hypothetical protein
LQITHFDGAGLISLCKRLRLDLQTSTAIAARFLVERSRALFTAPF